MSTIDFFCQVGDIQNDMPGGGGWNGGGWAVDGWLENCCEGGGWLANCWRYPGFVATAGACPLNWGGCGCCCCCGRYAWEVGMLVVVNVDWPNGRGIPNWDGWEERICS